MYGTVILACILLTLVPCYRQLPNTGAMNTKSSPASTYSNLVYNNSSVTLEPKSHTFK